VLLGVARQLLDARRPVALTFAGGGPLVDEVQALCAAFPGQATYVGFKEVRELPALLRDADVLVYPSRYDGWGVGVLEAMTAGKCVIASRAVASVHDLVTPGSTGLIVQAGHHDELRIAIEHCIGDREAVRRMGRLAQEAARGFDASQVAATFAANLRQIIHRQAAA
jgi:glycosyltransferase involved in cell wall biosynthesis